MNGEHRPKNLRHVARKLVLATLVCCAALAGCEILLRLFAPLHYVTQIREAREYDSEIGVRRRPDVHAFRLADYQEESISNSLGTGNFHDSFEGYRQLVFAVGDSFTEGLGVPADCSWPFQLDLLLNTDERGVYQKNFAVVNLGLSGYGTEQQIVLFQRYAELIGPPDFVLLFGCDNDFSDDVALEQGLKHLSYVQGNPGHSEFANRVAPYVDDIELLKRVFQLRNIIAKQRIQSADTFSEEISTAEKQRAKLSRLQSLCMEMNAALVVSWVARPENTSSYVWLRDWSGQSSVGFADYLPAAKQILLNKPQLGMINQHSTKHFRTWVNQTIARAFARRIKSDLPDPSLRGPAGSGLTN